MKNAKKVYRVAAPYKNVTYNNNDAVDACMCDAYSWLRLYREQNYTRETYIAALSYHDYCFSDSVLNVMTSHLAMFKSILFRWHHS